MPLTTIYQARDETQAQLLIAILQSHGIDASMEQGASATNAMFAPGMFRGGIGVLVDEAHADPARQIAEDFDQSGRAPAAESPQPTWTCPNCGEVVEAQFSDCWNCQTPRPTNAES